MNINPLDSFPNAFSPGMGLYRDLWHASRIGDFNRAVSIVNQSKSPIKQEELGQCFIVAASKGHKNIIDFFIALNIPIHPTDLRSSLAVALESNHKETADILINSVSKDALYEVFKSALANDCIRVVEAITKYIAPEHVFEVLESMLEEHCIKWAGLRTVKYCGYLIETTIRSLTPELSWEIFKIALDHNYSTLILMIVKSVPPEKLQLAFT